MQAEPKASGGAHIHIYRDSGWIGISLGQPRETSHGGGIRAEHSKAHSVLGSRRVILWEKPRGDGEGSRAASKCCTERWRCDLPAARHDVMARAPQRYPRSCLYLTVVIQKMKLDEQKAQGPFGPANTASNSQTMKIRLIFRLHRH